MKKITTLAIVLIAVLLAVPTAAFATGQPSANMTFGMMQIEYRFAAGETPNIPQEIERFGFTYRLVSQTEPVLESTLPAVRTYTYMVSGVLSKEMLEGVGGDTTKFEQVDVVMEREVDREITLPEDPAKEPPLLTNDVEDIPLTMPFIVTSGTDPSGFQKVELNRTGVTFDIAGMNDGLPTGFIATVVYRGIETYKEVGYFIASSTFTTNTEEGADLYVIVATYETDEMPPPVVSNVGTTVIGGGTQTGVDGLTAIEEQQVALQAGELNPLANIINGNVPLGNLAVKGVWSFFSLCFSIAGVVLAAWFVIGLIAKRKKEEKDLRELILRFMVIGFGLLTMFTWLLWDNFSYGMVWVNQYTLLIGILLAASAGLAVITKVLQGKTEEPGEAEAVEQTM